MWAEYQTVGVQRWSIALVLCLLSLSATSNSQGTIPTPHGLTYEKNPTEVSPGMIAFFGQPKVELPQAQNVPDPAWSTSADHAKSAPAVVDPVLRRKTTSSSLLVAGVVFVVLGIGLLATALLVAYMLHSRRSSKEWHPSGSSVVGLTAHWRSTTGPEVL